MTHFMNFIRDEEGLSVLEYALGAALLSIAAIVGLNAVGADLLRIFNVTVNTALGS